MAYQIDIKDDVLVFSTASFKAEKGSVLHSGIYNRELASSLAAGAAVMLSGFFFAIKYRVAAVHFMIALVVFVMLFLFFRTYVFKEPALEMVVDKQGSRVTISVKHIMERIIASYPLSEISGIKQSSVTFKPENPDGIRLVERIALQHATVITGFGEPAEFWNVDMAFKDGKGVTVFSSKDKADADDIATRLKNFIER